ncbi:MAG: glycosyltransferase, partial [Acidobacteria bacterium]|nr:glycosyltransferase [Acidobacteriota bacterium]
VDAAARLRDDDSMLLLCVGNGAECERIKRRAAEMQLDNLRFLPLLDEADFRGLMAASDVCLVTQQRSVSEIVFPSKIVTYLAAGCPVIASVNPECEVAQILHEAGAGTVVAAEDPTALVVALSALRRSDMRKAGENARKYASERWPSARVLGELERSLASAAGQAMRSLAWKGSKP